MDIYFNFDLPYIGIQHVSSDVNNTKLTNHNAKISILRPSMKPEILVYVNQLVFGNNGGNEEGEWQNEKRG